MHTTLRAKTITALKCKDKDKTHSRTKANSKAKSNTKGSTKAMAGATDGGTTETVIIITVTKATILLRRFGSG